MGRFLLRRCLLSIPTVLGVVLGMFVPLCVAEGDSGCMEEDARLPWIQLYGIEDGQRELRWTWWTWKAGITEDERQRVLERPHQEVTCFWNAEIFDGVAYVLLSWESQIIMDVLVNPTDVDACEKVATHSLGELFDMAEFSGEITFDGKIEEDGDGVRVVLRRWCDGHDGEPEVHRLPKWQENGGDSQDGARKDGAG